MSIEFGCCECRKLLRVPDSSAGKQARCPVCESIQEIPSEPEAAATQTANPASPEADSLPPASNSPLAAMPTSTNPFAEAATPDADNPFAVNETNPYAAPTSGAGIVNPISFGAGTEAWARTSVEGPANSLVAVAGVALVFSVIGLAINLSDLLVTGNLELAAYAVIETLMIVIPYGFVVYGALRMKQLKDYNWAIVASILAMLPCTGCCILGLPVGIWSLVVLCNPTIRAAFR